MNKVMCPWCGEEMYTTGEKILPFYYHGWLVCPECDSRSPESEGKTAEEATKAAYAAATRRPPNRATKETSYDDLNRLISEGSAIMESAFNEVSRRFGIPCSYTVETKPTAADIEAARKEHT